MIDLKQFKSILCLNGILPEIHFFQTDLPIIAADGAANTLVKMGITPLLTIGDLDSIDPDLRASINCLHHDDQNYCDFQKAFFYLEKHHLLPTIILGMGGGYLDHVLNNINLFLRSNSVLYAPPLYGFVLHDGDKKELLLPVDTKISLLGIPEATVSTHGLKWDLTHRQLTFPGSNSCFNRTVLNRISVEAHDGRVLIFIYETSTP